MKMQRFKDTRLWVLQMAIIAVVAILAWEAIRFVPTADAQTGATLPNAAAQRKQMIDEIKKTNAQLVQLTKQVGEMQKVLTSGEVVVQPKGQARK